VFSGTSYDTKGMLSVMLMDVEGTKNADGSRRIDLTKEKRDQIFQMYPAVRKAFEAEVPLNKTETDFWVAYFQSEFFARDKGGRATAGADDAFGRTDDMFSRYEERLGESSDRRSAPSSSSGSALSKVCKKNLAGLVGSDVDLTAVLGDFGPADASNLGELSIQFCCDGDHCIVFSVINLMSVSQGYVLDPAFILLLSLLLDCFIHPIFTASTSYSIN
jgi:BSD domain